MKTKIKYIIISFFLSVALFAQQKMTDAEIKTFKASVEKEASKMTALTADFVQQKHMDILSKAIESKGVFYLKSPNKLLLEYQTPQKMKIVFKEGKMHVKSNGKVTTTDLAKNKKFKQLNDLIVGSYNGNLLNDKAFDIVYSKKGNAKIAKLTPKEKAITKYIKAIELYFNNNETTVSEVKLMEPSNDYTLIIFKNKKTNAEVSDSVFNF